MLFPPLTMLTVAESHLGERDEREALQKAGSPVVVSPKTKLRALTVAEHPQDGSFRSSSRSLGGHSRDSLMAGNFRDAHARLEMVMSPKHRSASDTGQRQLLRIRVVPTFI